MPQKCIPDIDFKGLSEDYKLYVVIMMHEKDLWFIRISASQLSPSSSSKRSVQLCIDTTTNNLPSICASIKADSSLLECDSTGNSFLETCTCSGTADTSLLVHVTAGPLFASSNFSYFSWNTNTSVQILLDLKLYCRNHYYFLKELKKMCLWNTMLLVSDLKNIRIPVFKGTLK